VSLLAETYLDNADCFQPYRWHHHPQDNSAPNVCTSEIEVLEFMQALIAALKPRLMVELGTNAGIAAEYYLKGLPESSKLFTIENDPEMYKLAKVRLAPYGERVELVFGDAVMFGKSFQTVDNLDFVFVDTGGISRFEEMFTWVPKLSSVGVMAVHDTDTARAMRVQAESVARTYNMQIIHLPTSRSFTLMRRI
jgi:predicted O-methyltransferase YrrM